MLLFFAIAFALAVLLHSSHSYRIFSFNPARKLISIPRISGTTGEPDVNYPAGEDVRHLQKEFACLSLGGDSIELNAFMQWEEIQALLADNLATMDEVKEIWTKYASKVQEDTEINFDTFLQINRDLDDLFDDIDENDLESSTESTDELSVNDVNDEDVEGVWDPLLQSTKLFEKDFNDYLQAFFTTNKQDSDFLSYDQFASWSDVREVLSDGSVDMSCLEDLWVEAVLYKNRNDPVFDNGLPDFVSIRDYQDKEEFMIDLDTFFRLNFRLEEVMEDIKDALESLSDEDVQEFYKKEFVALTTGERLLTFEKFMNWSMMQDLLNDEEITLSQTESLWMALPKEDVKKPVSDRGFAPPDTVQGRKIEGITLEEFIALNEAIEDAMTSLNVKIGEDLEYMNYSR